MTNLAAEAVRKPHAAPGSVAFILKKSLMSALVALVLFSLMSGVRTEAGNTTGQLVFWTRFGDLAALVAAVFAGSILVELFRGWIKIKLILVVEGLIVTLAGREKDE